MINITELDREMAAMIAGHEVPDSEIVEFKRSYEQWLAEMESEDSPEIVCNDSDFVVN